MSQLTPYLWIVVVGGLCCFFMGFGIGANDVANNFGSSVGSGAIDLKWAIVIAGIFEFIGCVAFGSTVTDAVRSKILDMEAFDDAVDVFMFGNMCALLVGGMWLVSASRFGLPVSTTHSIIGALIGFGLVTRPHAVNWSEIGMIVLSWFVSPLLAGIVGGTLFVLCRKFVLRRADPVKAGFRSLPILMFFLFSVFCLFFMLKNPMVINTSCPQKDEDGELVRSSPCVVKKWVDSHMGIAIGISFGLAVGFTLIFTPIGFWLARRRIERFDQIQQNEKEVATVEEDSDYDDEIVKGLHLSTSTSFSSKTTDVTLNKNVFTSTWWKSKWSGMPWNSDLVADALEEDQKATEIHDTSEDFGERAETFFCFMQVISATVASIVHGSNDVANATAPFATIYGIYTSGMLEDKVDTPIWILALGGLSIGVGLALYGYRVIKSVGVKITRITPSRGFSIEIGCALVIVVASMLGLPVSTTHCQVGGTVGVGILDETEGYERKWYEFKIFNYSRINWWLVLRIAVSWVATLILVAVVCGLVTAFGVHGPTTVTQYYIPDGPWLA